MPEPLRIAVESAPQDRPAVAIRKANLRDVGPLLPLINGYAAQGIMLPRTEFELSESIRDFIVAVSRNEIAGCGALHFYGPATGEVRSLAVRPELKNLGVGKRLVEALETEARDHGLHSLFAFTYVPKFFAKLGFVEACREDLPSKVWKDCLKCPKFQCCDEIAMRKILVPLSGPTPVWRDEVPAGTDALEPVLLPILKSHPSA